GLGGFGREEAAVLALREVLRDLEPRLRRNAPFDECEERVLVEAADAALHEASVRSWFSGLRHEATPQFTPTVGHPRDDRRRTIYCDIRGRRRVLEKRSEETIARAPSPVVHS